MLDQSAEFIDKNVAEVAYPCVTVRQDYTKDGSSHAYLTTHDYAKTPVGATVLNGVIEDISAKTQRLSVDKGTSEIGDISIRLTDVDYAVTKALFDNAEGTDSLKGREQTAYAGFKDLEFESYAKSYTQIVDGGITKDGDSYVISCSDIQREMRTKLFPKIELTITATIPDDPAHPDYNTIKVLSTADICGMVNPSASTDAPGVNCFYIERVSGDDREVIRCLVAGMDATTIIVDPSGGRGALNTTALEHIVDPNGSASTKFRQYWFMSSSPIELMYMMLTGEQLISQGAVVPPGMSIGIPASKVRRDDYISIGSDLLDTASPADSIVLEFQGDALKEQDGKKFISEQITFPLGLFMPIYSDGAVGLSKLSNVKMDSAYDAVFDNDNVIKSSPIRKNYSAINNAFIVNWDWNQHKKRFNRSFPLIDEFSAARYDSIKEKTLNLYGLNSAKHSVDTLRDVFNRIRDFSSYEVYEMSVSVLPEMNFLEEGDFVRYRDDLELDPKTNLPIDRTFLIVRKTENPLTGDLSFNLVGSSAPADIIDIGSGQAVISDVDYEAHGKGDPARDFELLAAGLFTNVNGVLHLEQDFTFNGGASSNSPSSWLYIDKDLFVDPGVTLALTKNAQVWHKGVVTNQGTITTAGQGHAGGTGATALIPLPYDRATGNATAGQLGVAGASRSQQGILWDTEEWHWIYSMGAGSFSSYGIGSTFSLLPYLSIKYENGTIHGIPDDLSGTSGAGGGPVADGRGYRAYAPQYRGYGGDGGASGGGCAWICRGAYRSGSGLFTTDGADGLQGEAVSINGRTLYGGAGGGGNPGAFLFIIDGLAINAPDFSVGFSSKIGATPAQGVVLYRQDDGGKTKVSSGRMPPSVSWYVDNGQVIQIDDTDKTAWFRTFIVPPVQELEVEENGSKTSPPASISIPQSGNSQLKKNADGTVTARAYCSVGASPDTLLKGYQWQYKINGGDWITRSSYVSPKTLWIRVDDVVEGNQIVFRCRAINTSRVESPWVTSVQHTVVGKSENPNPPSSLTGVGVVNGIEWALGGTPDADVISVELHTGPNTSFANVDSIKKFSSSGVILEPLSGAQTRYGWARYQDSSGNWSVFAPLSSAVGASAASLAQDYAVISNTPGGRGVNLNSPRYASFNASDSPPFATNGSAGTAAIDSAVSHSGGASLKIIATAADMFVYFGASSGDYNIQLTSNKKWIVSFWVAGSAGGEPVVLYLRTSDGVFNGPYSFVASATANEWARRSVEIDLSSNSSESAIIRIDNDISGNTIWIDDIQVEESIGASSAPSANSLPPSSDALQLQNAPAEAGADSTANNTAAGIAGQGALATQSEADFATQIVGSEKPADNADVTKDILELLLLLTQGGLQLGGDSAKLLLGNATGYKLGSGLYAGMSGVPGAAKAGFHVGDPAAEQYLAYSPTTGDVELGRNTELRGASAYNNSSLNWHAIFRSIDGLSPFTIGTNSAATVNRYGLSLIGGETVTSYVSVSESLRYAGNLPTFDKKILLKTNIHFEQTTVPSTMSPGELSLGTASIKGAWVEWDAAGIITVGVKQQAYSAVTKLSASQISAFSSNAIEIVFVPSDAVYFYLNGALIESITTADAGSGMPSGLFGDTTSLWEMRVYGVDGAIDDPFELITRELWVSQDP